MFRHGAPSPRPALPPSAFPSGLQPVTSDRPKDTSQRRMSRVDMDFEQALLAGGTVLLKEGLDVNSLGIVDISPSLSPASPTPPPKDYRTAPSTPTVVPPTPTPAAGPSSARLQPASSPTPLAADIFYDPDDSDHQTKRRSIYRSPGTSSSPDLATLLRKAKAKGGVVSSTQLREREREKRYEQPPPLPNNTGPGAGLRPPNGTIRQRSSTAAGAALPPTPMTISPNSTPIPGTMRGMASPTSSDWVLTSPRPHDASTKVPKTSVRAKTSAFLGKMLGQSTVRDRARTENQLSSLPVSPTSAAPSIFDTFSREADNQTTPITSPIADVFSKSSGSPAVAKPLPPILTPHVTPASDESDHSDDNSVVLVDQSPVRRARPPSEQSLPKKPLETMSKLANRNKRRSMSVGEVELKQAMAASSLVTPLPRSSDDADRPVEGGWDTTLHGIISDFKGELSQLDPISSSFDLRDPSTPSRRAALARSKTDGYVLPREGERPDAKNKTVTSSSRANTAPPMLTLQTGFLSEDGRTRNITPMSPTKTNTEAPIVPPRVSSLHSPLRARAGSSAGSSPRPVNMKHGSSPLRTRNGNPFGPRSPRGRHAPSSSRDATRLAMQHRSSASSSEPSLIPGGNDVRGRSPAPLAATSQQDLTTNDLVLTRFPSKNQSPTRGDDSADMEARGKELASRCWAEDEEFLAKEKIAEWLGGQGRINKIALPYYLDFFDFKGLRLDLAFRRLCAKLYLKAETQQVDRILEEFSRRYWDCNPGGLYGSASVVHAVSYSLLLLNTDLHVADLTTRMSRSQFVRNTLTAIQMQLPSAQGNHESNYDDAGSARGSDGTETIGSATRSKRSASITSWNSISRETIMSSHNLSSTPQGGSSSGQPSNNGSTTSVQLSSGQESRTGNSSTTSIVYGRNWENDMEALLKDIYNAIKSQQILQPQGSALAARSSTSSLSPGGAVMRNRSLRGPPDRLTTLKRGSIRGIQTILGAPSSASPYSSNSSIEGRVSPSPSFATSTHEGLHGPSSFLTPALGFASNLSHTIIREAQEDDDRSIRSHESNSTNISITDEELALLGAPWAKEGMLCRKQYWESINKRAKDKAWLDVFVVIQRGQLNMFTFGEHGGGGGKVVGGGNWLENADPVGTVQLAHSLAHALPPPGYNRQRPHCMVLTLSNGGVYFYQAGTEELVNEWVSTCNYWAARTSKEPLAGGVSNMEYGWNRVADPVSHGRSMSDNESPKDVDYSDSISVRSGRSTRSRFGWKEGAATVRATHSPYVDKTVINDWKPPLPPTVSSVHDEESQLDALRKHVTSMKKDLKRHTELREPMAALYPPRSSNATKAQSNWEKKSQYLLTEIVKYDSYIDSLQAAMSLRLKKRGEKALERALVTASPEGEEPPAASKGKWKGYPEEETIPEGDEPTTPAAVQQFNSHRRGAAETS